MESKEIVSKGVFCVSRTISVVSGGTDGGGGILRVFPIPHLTKRGDDIKVLDRLTVRVSSTSHLSTTYLFTYLSSQREELDPRRRRDQETPYRALRNE